MFGIPNYCKIDAEGFEEEILAGIGDYKIPLISLEYKKLYHLNTIKKLESGGYKKYNFSLRSDYYFIFRKFERLENLTEALKSFMVGELFAY